MEGKVEQFMHYKLIETAGFEMDIKWLITFIIYLAIAFTIMLLIKKLLQTATKKGWWIGEQREKSIYNSVRVPIVLILLEETINLFGEDNFVHDFFNYHLAEAASFNLTLRSILLVIAVILLMRFIIAVIEFVIHRSLKEKPWITNATEYSFLKLTSYALYIIAVFIGIKAVGINISILMGASAALIVGLGFGLQDIFKDFVSGVLILFEGNFKVGDIIQYKDVLARVTRIDLRTSRVITRDGNRILIPNSILITNEIINWSISNVNSRFMVEVSVAYGSDVQLVKELLLKCAADHKLVTRKKDTTVFFDDFGDSALIFKLYFWSNKTWDENPMKSEIRFSIDKAFRENNVKIPFPQRDLHVIPIV